MEKGRDSEERMGFVSNKKKSSGRLSRAFAKFSAADYVKSMVYGGMDGLVSTFAVVAGVTGADLSVGILIILGVASLFADGVSMAVGDYISSKTETGHFEKERAIEAKQVSENLEEEKAQLIEIFVKKGVSRQDATSTINTLSKYRDMFIELALNHEKGLVSDDENPIKNGIVTFFSFVIFGSTPVLAYVIPTWIMKSAFYGKVNVAFIIASFFTGLSMFILGAVTSKFTNTKWWKAGFMVFINGAFAAGVAYLIGYLLAFLGE